MFRGKSYQKRATSAGPSSQKRHNIQLGKPVAKRNKRIHTESYEATFETAKPTRSRLLTSGHDYGHKFGQLASKGPEQLVEQNLHLKVQLKDLNAKLNLTRTKIESQKKKHLLYSRKLNRQFQKQLYWSIDKGQDYLITGIKYQYQRLKQALQQKCNQLESIKQTLSYSNTYELSGYCESLEVQNKILIENIAYLKKKKRNASSSFEENSRFALEDLEYMLTEEKNKDQRNQQKIKVLEERLNKQSSSQKQLMKKISFLQKLIIQKENECYHMAKQVKTVERQKSKLTIQLKSFQTKIMQQQHRHEQTLNQLKQKADRQALAEKAMFQKTIKQKTLFIDKLQKEIAYLSTLLTYWKPLDDLERLDVNNSSLKSQKDKSISLNLNHSISLHGTNNLEMARSKTPLNLNLHIDQQQLSNDQKLIIRTSQKDDTLSRRDSSLNTIQREESDKLSKGDSNRQPRRSTKKWHQEAKKNRIVEFTQVEYLGELLRFKLIAAQKPLTDIKELFSCKITKGLCSKLEEQLITQRQVQQTLVNGPFSLSQSEAYVLSRYIIEDQGVQYVYSHEANEVERSIVKSIVKTVIGDYELPDLERGEEKWKWIKKVYSHNMQLALKSICPKGTVSKSKFLQLMNSLGIEADQETKNYLIAKMVQHSASLTALPYDHLFEPHENIN